DRDQQAIEALTKRFAGQDAQIIHGDYLSASQTLHEQGRTYDLILADLGVSSLHLDEPKRGFAFSLSGPLDMRMDTSQEFSAASLVNEWDEAELEDVLKRYGEEPRATVIARAIVAERPIATTKQLAKVIARSSGRPFKRRRVHPATKAFQAIRIAVNDELNQLKMSLPLWVDLLAPGGRLVVISFHSLEDRIVKNFFADHAGKYYTAELVALTKKPIMGVRDEIVSNPRARSAKLRAVEKIKNKKGQ
ncbi:16S rRNA (cytosine(1402)-N(4))-methyltransferase, partial [Candidatus Saccharibacteria bacterium CG10_big_fil_rev_8_21_14_0_10_47_8]